MTDEKDAGEGVMTLYYHKQSKAFLARSFSAIMIAAHAGKKLDIQPLPSAEEMAAMGCFAVPVMKFADGLTVSQSFVICDTMGVRLGLVPTEANQLTKCRQLAMDVTDAGDQYTAKAVATASNEGKFEEGFVEGRLVKWLTHFENIRAKNAESKFMIGDTLTYLDYMMLAYLEAIACMLGDDHFAKGGFKELDAFFTRMKDEAGYKHYLSLGTVVYGPIMRKEIIKEEAKSAE